MQSKGESNCHGITDQFKRRLVEYETKLVRLATILDKGKNSNDQHRNVCPRH